MVVRRVELDASRGDECLGRRRRVRPALGHHGDVGRPAQRVAELLPGQRGAGVQEHPFPQPRNDVPGGGHAGEQGGRGVQPPADLGVGRLDRRRQPPVATGERPDQIGTPAGGDAPVDVHRGRPLGAEGVTEQLQADVDRTHLGGELDGRRFMVGSHG